MVFVANFQFIDMLATIQDIFIIFRMMNDEVFQKFPSRYFKMTMYVDTTFMYLYMLKEPNTSKHIFRYPSQ